jgi:hypothetical protein
METWQTKKQQGTDGIWRVDLAPRKTHLDGTEMFLSVRNSSHDPKKRQPISKVHKNGAGQSKVAEPVV